MSYRFASAFGSRSSWGLAVLNSAAALLVIVVLADCFSAVLYPFPLDYGEGPLLDQVLRLSRFESIYRSDFSTPPYVVTNYPPIFQLIQLPFIWFFGPALWYGRLISVVAFLLSGFFVGRIIKQLTASSHVAVFGGLLFLTVPYVGLWARLNRVDSLALCFSLAGLSVLLSNSNKFRGDLCAAVLLALAVFTRQSYLLCAPVTAVLWLSQRYSLLVAARFAVVFAMLIAVGVALLMAVSSGGFYAHTILANINEFQIERAGVAIRDLVLLSPGLLLCAVASLFSRRFNSSDTRLFVSTYALCALISGMTIGKAGSEVNYLLELMVALILLAMSAPALRARLSGRRTFLEAVLTSQVLIFSVFYMQNYRLHRYVGVDTDFFREIRELIAQSRRPVLADKLLALIPLAGKQIYFQPFEFTQLSRAGRWSEAEFVAQLQRAEFDLIVREEGRKFIMDERWTPAMNTALHSSYTRRAVNARYATYQAIVNEDK